jgi:rhodanese-related sulfurtransferase/DNA-binding transcriptional ArsR family regulator
MKRGGTSREFKQALYAQFTRIAKALASPGRLEMLDLLSQGPYTVEELAGAAHLSVANASQHLHVLRDAKLVVASKSGLHVTYRLSDDAVAQLYASLREVAQRQLPELEPITRGLFSARDGVRSIDRDDLVRQIRAGDVTLLDVRPRREYEAGHIGGALSIPVDELAKRLDEIPKRKKVVAYCRGPYCVFAVDAVRLLRARGFRAHAMEDGVTEWRRLGLPVATTSQEAS